MTNPAGGPPEGTMVQGAVIAGRYVLDRVIGAGGFSQVWLAQDRDLKRSVALKFLKQELMSDEAALADLKAEVLLTQTLRHHHIVQIYDFLRDQQTVGYAMEYVKGKTLFTLAAERPHRCFEPGDIGEWTTALCSALNYAHTARGGRRAVVHRDLKPGNLMVDDNGELRVLDFGISRTITETRFRATEPGDAMVVGTIPYMSPEQLRGRPASPADDIYALGATLYELLTSRPPFYTGAVHLQVLNEPAPTMTERRTELAIPGPPIPPVWEEIIGACLAKEAKDRPATVREVYERLGLEASSQIRPSPRLKSQPAPDPTLRTVPLGPARERVTPWWKRNGIRFGAAALTVAVVSVLIVGIDRIAESIGIGSQPAGPGAQSSSPVAVDPDASLRQDIRDAFDRNAFDRAAPLVDRLLAKVPADAEASAWKRQIDAGRLKNDVRTAIAREDTVAARQAVDQLRAMASGDDDLPDLERDLGTLIGSLWERKRLAQPEKAASQDAPPGAGGPTEAELLAERDRQLDARARTLETRIEQALAGGDVGAAGPLVTELREIRPKTPELPDLERRLTELQRIRELRASIAGAMAAGMWSDARTATDELLQLVPADPEAARWQVEITAQVARGEIRELLKAYENAWESRDADAYKRLWPTMPGDVYRQIAASFADLKAIALDLTEVRIDVQDDRATVAMSETRAFTQRTGNSPKPLTSPVVLEVGRNGAGRWEITQRKVQ